MSEPSQGAGQLAAVILTKNEEQHLGDCLSTLAWAGERIVFDSYSTDRTIEIARTAGARVVQHAFSDFASQRNAALDAVETEWVLFVDADERVTPDLAGEVLSVIGREGESARAGCLSFDWACRGLCRSRPGPRAAGRWPLGI